MTKLLSHSFIFLYFFLIDLHNGKYTLFLTVLGTRERKFWNMENKFATGKQKGEMQDVKALQERAPTLATSSTTATTTVSSTTSSSTTMIFHIFLVLGNNKKQKSCVFQFCEPILSHFFLVSRDTTEQNFVLILVSWNSAKQFQFRILCFAKIKKERKSTTQFCTCITDCTKKRLDILKKQKSSNSVLFRNAGTQIFNRENKFLYRKVGSLCNDVIT